MENKLFIFNFIFNKNSASVIANTEAESIRLLRNLGVDITMYQGYEVTKRIIKPEVLSVSVKKQSPPV